VRQLQLQQRSRLRCTVYTAPWAALTLLGLAVQAQAQTVPIAPVAPVAPNAGQLQRQTEQILSPPAAAVPPVPSAPAAAIDRSGPPLTIERFAIEGASLIPADELARQLDAYRGRPLSLGELQAATQELVGYYRERGWYARVQLPPQDASSGTLRIRIIEGRFGRLLVEPDTARNTTQRTDTAAVERLVGSRLHSGEPYAQADLERGLLLANDLPGVRADGVLQAGEQGGTSDLALRIQDRPLFSGQVGLNNAGSRFTGRAQASAQLALNSPSGRGDQLGLSALAAERLSYAALGYSLPLGSDGLRANVAVSELRYRLGKDFAALDARGTARTVSAGLAYPLRRSAAFNLWLGLDVVEGRYHDDSLGVALRERRVSSLALSLYGNARDGWGGGGASEWRVALGQGRVALGQSGEQAQDAAGPRTAGSFTRLNYELRREQLLGESFYLRVRLAGQQASGNLDASQKFALGGPYGVRGYPGDDGLGDSGTLLQVELHRPLPWAVGLDGFAFLDGGVVRQHQNPWVGWDTRGSGRNSYGLAAAGLGLNWQSASGFSASAILAVPLGGNPGSGVAGRNQDGSRTANWLWLTLAQRF
jgi:hemolysin activation/secretion protein